MIFTNGTIEFKKKTAHGIDPQTGYAIKSEATWGEPIPCHWLFKSVNLLQLVNNEPHVHENYDILIDEQEVQGEQLRLTDQRTGRVLGEFSITAIEPLHAVSQIRISV